MPTYHFVWGTKYRRPILIDNDVKESFRAIVRTLAEQEGWEIVAMEVMPDHVHLLLTIPPSTAPSRVMNRVKGVTSKELRQHYGRALKRSIPKALWAPHFWCEGVGRTNERTVKGYIQAQEIIAKRRSNAKRV